MPTRWRWATSSPEPAPGRAPAMTEPKPINCREALEHLQDYLKRELTPELAVEIREHLHRCRPCFSHAKFEENFLILLATQAKRETCPGKLRARIMELLRAEAQEG